jgi:putative heme iron utilization protein
MSPRRHAPPGGSTGRQQELLYDPAVPTPTHAERARTLVEQLGTGTLCTTSRDPAGYPYGSLVTFGLDDGSPVFLISALAEHTQNLHGDPRCSLLVAEPGDGDPLARGRVTLIGSAEKLDRGVDETARHAFLERHPDSAYYADFKDFAFWRMPVAAVRYIGGYGRMSWVDRADWTAARPDPLAPFAAGILEHMNADHAETMVLYCKAFSRATDTSAARMTGVDRYGFEMSATTGSGPRPIRLAFSRQVETAEAVRRELVELAKKARACRLPS